MKLGFFHILLIFVCCKFGCIIAHETIDDDDEDLLKCDACKVIAKQFAESFSKTKEETSHSKLTEDEYIEAAESTCDEDWNSYYSSKKDGKNRLLEAKEEDEVDTFWGVRLQDLCDELLAESADEKTLYTAWSESEAKLEEYLCNGENTFSACSVESTFEWPSDDYDDYDDISPLHDEF